MNSGFNPEWLVVPDSGVCLTLPLILNGCCSRLRCMFDEVPMPWDWPVEVNYHEAKAYCTWKGPQYRLPFEAEHRVMRGEQVLQRALS